MRTQSVFGDYQVITAKGSIQRRFARHWFVLADGGMGLLSSVGNPINGIHGPSGTSYIYLGSLGYSGREHTLTATYSRQVGDYYGFAAGSSTSAVVAWNWRNRSQRWGISTTAGRQRLSGSALGDLTVWEATAGLSRALGRQATITWSYVNLTDTASTVREGVFSAHAARVSIVWVPFLRELSPRGSRQ